jgi:anti-anti-sigma factor
MKLTHRQPKPGLVVVELSGRISMGDDCAQIDQTVEQHIQRDEKHFIFDLTAVHHIDSAVVGQIVKSHSRLLRSGGKLRIAGAAGMVHGVLKLTQVSRVIEMFPTTAAASEGFPPIS